MKITRWNFILSVSCALLATAFSTLAAPVVLVPTNAVWRYLADGSDQGAAWRAPGFNDSSWLSGAAQLGFGDGDETTLINISPDPATRPVTVYFRKSVLVPNGVSDVILRLMRDDGAVVYVNGVEVYRNNMPAGPITYNTFAPIAVGVPDESTFLETVVPPSAFVAGANVIAVEMHQVNITSSDLSFALELKANVATPWPQVNVTALDAEAREISPLLAIPENPAVFRISRTGPTNNSLNLGIRLGGTASNGVDYSFVSNMVTIPAGSAFADVFISVLDDSLAEGTETVTLTLAPTPCPDCYELGTNTTATAVILDNETANTPPVVSILSPTEGATFTAPTNILLRASASDAEDGNDITVEFYLGTLRIGVATFVPALCPSPECPYYALLWSNAPTGNLPIFAIARDKSGASTVSAPVHITVQPKPTGGDVTLIPAGSVWKYLDNGTDQGSVWRSKEFNDTAWASGPAQLGYGDGDEATVVNFGADPANKYITTYFRKSILVPSGATQFTLRLLRDDGAVVYVNGVEVFRDNMPAGPIAYNTLAVVVNPDENAFIETAIPASVFVAGTNVIAVEVHQVNAPSSDLGFDLELIAKFGTLGPQVNVTAIDAEAREISPLLDIPENPAVFRVTRSGSTDNALSVAIRLSGTATNAFDYSFVSNRVTIPAGSASADVFINVLDDNLFEGTESVILTLLPSPCPECYTVGNNASATAFILDNEANNVPPTVSIVSPTNGATFVAPANIIVLASVSDPDGLARNATVQVFANNQSLGSAQVTDPGPEHNQAFRFIWTNAPPGNYNLTVQARDEAGAFFGASVQITVLNPTVGTNVVLIPSGSIWNYLDDGTDQGTAWRLPSFDDSAWAQGPAQLGYGDLDEATILAFGPDAGNKYITYYFRRAFNVSNAAALSNLVVQLLRDDGGVVYLNGVEVFRSNMPTGPVNYRTLAVLSVGGPDETTQFYPVQIPSSLLVNGRNVLAVEIHQATATSADVSFDLALTADTTTPGTNAPPSIVINSPTNGASFAAPAAIPLIATLHDPDGTAANGTVEFLANSVSLGQAQLADPGPLNDAAFRLVWTNPPPGNYTLTARARDASGLSAVSAPVTITVQQTQPPTGEREVHGIGVYSGNYNGSSSPNHEQGVANVIVDRPGKRVTLFLSAYEPVIWHVSATANTTIEKVILAGYYQQVVDGLAPGVPVLTRFYYNDSGVSGDYFWTGYSIGSVEFLRAVPKLCNLTGLDISSFQGAYTAPATPYTISGIQNDPRLRCDYPQPADPAQLPALTFNMFFYNQGLGFYERHYTLAGPQDGSRLLPGMRLVADNSGEQYYGTESHAAWKYNGEDGLQEMSLGSGVPELSWPMGIGFDSQRNRTLLVSLGGEGFLYGYSPVNQQWSVISSMNNRDANGLSYHAADDSIYAVATTHDDTHSRVIWRFNANGEYLSQIPLPPMPFDFGPSGYETELVSVGDYLVLLIEPGYQYFYPSSAAESRIYLIDPRTSQVWLTYRKVLLPDSDDDGVPDSQDQCPNTPRGEAVDSHGCGSSQMDSDHDGVPNNLDQCPNTPPGTLVDSQGCPQIRSCRPEIQWQVELGDTDNEQALKVLQTPDGGYLVGGQKYHTGKMWLLRFSSAGAKLWEKQLGTTTTDYLKDLQPVAAGGYIIAGAGFGSNPNDYQAELVRIDESGNVLWSRSYGGTGIDIFESVHQTSDGGFIAVGNSDSAVGAGKTSPNFGLRDAWVVRVDANGNKQWDRSYGGQLHEFGTAVLQALDGSYLVSVSSESPAGGNKSSTGFGAFDGWLLKLNPAGDKIWERAYGTTNHDWLVVADVLPNGSALLTGTGGDSPSGNKTSPGFGQSDAWVLLIDSAGNTIWERTFGGNDFDTLLAADRMQGGGYILAGSSQSSPSGNKTSPKVAGNDFWLVRIDAGGAKVWERSIGGGGSYGSLANAVKQTSDGGFIVVGDTFNGIGGDKTVPWYGSGDGWLLKLSPENNDCDNDGVPNNLDQCPNTPEGEVVNVHGCSIAQLCPCDQTWRNHNEYVQCVTSTAQDFVNAGLITASRKEQIVDAARHSTCGRRRPRLVMPQQVEASIKAGGCHLLLDGDGPETCVIECSEDLLRWRPISTNIVDGVQITITDPGASTAPRRFYRLQPPAP